MQLTSSRSNMIAVENIAGTTYQPFSYAAPLARFTGDSRKAVHASLIRMEPSHWRLIVAALTATGL
jgi:hypothetical protein